MLYMIVNRIRANLTSAQMAELGRLAQGFYENVPSGVALIGDWAAQDGSCTFALMEADDPSLLEALQAPFRPFVDMQMLPVWPVKGWGQRQG
jgi:hypothetical protein